jgi:pyruvate/2-oxoglutarate/acetoin dehydrogenase E1 component
MKTAEVISTLTEELIRNHKGLVLGQCLTAVGWVGGTVPKLPEDPGLIELSMADVAGGSIAVGAALSGRRVIYIVRYQGFMWYNAASVVNYAAKSKDMWGIPCPILVRGIAMDGSIGPVASGVSHAMIARMPGIVVTAPMSGSEWEQVYNWWLNHDDPVYISESRRSFELDEGMGNTISDNPVATLIAVGAARISAEETLALFKTDSINVSNFGVVWLKPLALSSELIESVRQSKVSVVVDSDYESCSMATTIAHKLQQLTGRRVDVLGLEERSAGFSRESDNTTPSSSTIHNYVLKRLETENMVNK